MRRVYAANAGREQRQKTSSALEGVGISSSNSCQRRLNSPAADNSYRSATLRTLSGNRHWLGSGASIRACRANGSLNPSLPVHIAVDANMGAGLRLARSEACTGSRRVARKGGCGHCRLLPLAVVAVRPSLHREASHLEPWPSPGRGPLSRPGLNAPALAGNPDWVSPCPLRQPPTSESLLAVTPAAQSDQGRDLAA
jgi:hypothetical protein